MFTSVTGTLKKSRERSRERSERRRGEGDVKLDLATTVLLHSLFTCCKLWLACHTHRMAVRRQASSFLLLRSQSLLQTWSVIVFITFFILELRRGRNDWFCAIFFRTTLHSNLSRHGFNILMGIDEYNYIQYLCLLMFTDRFSHFISVSGVLCFFV